MQDDFHYKTDSIDGHSPAKGAEAWKLWVDQGVISTDGTQASLITNGGKAGAGGHVRVTYPFDLAGGTLYTLKVTFQFKPVQSEKVGWAGFGFGNGENGSPDNEPWLFICPQRESSDDSGAKGLASHQEAGSTTIPAADFSLPITAKITWNTSTGEAQYCINNQVESEWTRKIPVSSDRFNVFLEGATCGAVNVTNITLTAEPAKK